MIGGKVYSHLLRVREEKGGGLLLLIDPDSVEEQQYLATVRAAAECGVDAVLVGTSFMLNFNFPSAVKKIKQATPLPVVIFPGSFAQITPDADAVIFSCLISGRNPAYLIEEQSRGAPLVKKYGLEVIPTGYMLIESGSMTSVQYISGTTPIPRTKNDIACAHALAAQYLGMKLVYLEAGSGATHPVPEEMVRAVSGYIDIPVVVGGGITSPDACAAVLEAGASFVVVGNALEGDTDSGRLSELACAVHPKETIRV